MAGDRDTMASGSLVDACAFLAQRMHKGQTYRNGPYTDHLEHVVSVMRRFGVTDECLLGAGYLHDVLEDTPLTHGDLVAHLELCFGREVSLRVGDLVDAVTDGPGANRAERKEKPYARIPEVEGALVVKLADRIANVEACYADLHLDAERHRLLKMYQDEQSEFMRRLIAPSPTDHEFALWMYLGVLLRRPAFTAGKEPT